MVTASGDGAANSSYDSFASLGRKAEANMMLGEVAPGGAGSGLYGLVAMARLAVFLGGLMIGRTPEYLKQRLHARHIKLVSLYILVLPTVILVGCAVAIALPGEVKSMLNNGAHGLLEVLYAFTSSGLAWASTADASTPYIQIAMQMLLPGGGLGLTTAPATKAIMGSLSADMAGVGSAINDTTRDLGGMLGVAIVGSVFASVYSSRLGAEGALTALPGDVRTTMQRSMAAAYHVIAQLPAGRIAGVRDAVNDVFLNGLQVGSLVCAGIALGAASAVAVMLPPRARQSSTAAAEIELPESEAVCA